MSDEDLRSSVSRLMRGLNHDLKNPLGAADGYVDLLLQGFRGDITPEQRQTLERVRTLIAAGVAILEDVVAFARASIGELKVRPGDSDVKPIVRMTMERHAARAANANITLAFDAPDEPMRAVTDSDVVGQIVDRLLANALDHTPEGGRVDVRVREEGEGLTVQVSDSGPGVAEKDRERVFVAFERGPAPARPRESAGIGFGLALARALAERLEGELRLEEGTDSTFTLAIPKKMAAPAEDAASPMTKAG